jgi:hypothetical protein
MLLAKDEDVVEKLSPQSAGEALGERVHDSVLVAWARRWRAIS